VVWNQEQQPIIRDGSIEERLHEHMAATVSGDVQRAYGLFLGLAADEHVRPLTPVPGRKAGRLGEPPLP
jgi:hypothetical protein